MMVSAKVRCSSVVVGSMDHVGKLFWVSVALSGLAQEDALCPGACEWLRCCQLAWLLPPLLSHPCAAPRRCCLLLLIASAHQTFSPARGFLRSQAVASGLHWGLRSGEGAGVGWGCNPAPWPPQPSAALRHAAHILALER